MLSWFIWRQRERGLVPVSKQQIVTLRQSAHAENLPDEAIIRIAEVQTERAMVRTLIDMEMEKGLHYDVIPGTGDKPTLLQAGGESLRSLFKLQPEMHHTERYHDGDHVTYTVTCNIKDRHGQQVGAGIGVCSTRESKYRYRYQDPTCPECGKPYIKVSKFKPVGSFYCYGKIGGCGAKFAKEDERITDQSTGKVENPDLADVWNTCCKMAEKRAFMSAIKQATSASDVVTVDLEDQQGSPRDSDVTPAPAQGGGQQQRPPANRSAGGHQEEAKRLFNEIATTANNEDLWSGDERDSIREQVEKVRASRRIDELRKLASFVRDENTKKVAARTAAAAEVVDAEPAPEGTVEDAPPADDFQGDDPGLSVAITSKPWPYTEDGKKKWGARVPDCDNLQVGQMLVGHDCRWRKAHQVRHEGGQSATRDGSLLVETADERPYDPGAEGQGEMFDGEGGPEPDDDGASDAFDDDDDIPF